MNSDTMTSTRKMLIAVLAAAAAMVQPNMAAAGCKGGFCVHGRDGKGVHVVEFTSTFTNVHHYNARTREGHMVGSSFSQQVEVGRNVRSFVIDDAPSRGEKLRFSIQACAYGGFPPRSNCGPWVEFQHTMKE